MSNEYTYIKEKLQKLHLQENLLNKEMGNFDKQIHTLKKKKLKITKRISANMKYRNLLINQL